jgi:hypothetical protein
MVAAVGAISLALGQSGAICCYRLGGRWVDAAGEDAICTKGAYQPSGTIAQRQKRYNRRDTHIGVLRVCFVGTAPICVRVSTE